MFGSNNSKNVTSIIFYTSISTQKLGRMEFLILIYDSIGRKKEHRSLEKFPTPNKAEFWT